MGARQEHVTYFLARLKARDVAAYKAFLKSVENLTGQAILTRLADAILSGDTDTVIRILGLNDSVFAPLDEALRETYIEGSVAASVGLRSGSYGARMLVRFNVRNTYAEDWLSAAAGRRVTGYLREAQQIIRETLLDGLQAGQNPLDTARDLVGVLTRGSKVRKGGTIMLTAPRARTVRRVREALLAGDVAGLQHYLGLELRDKRFDSLIRKAIKAGGGKFPKEKTQQIVGALAEAYLKERARLISRTETLASMNAGKHEAFRQATERAGISDDHIQREWDSTGDQKVRPDHQHLNGQKVKGINTPYRLPDGSPIDHPGDMNAGVKQVANCRCLEYMEVDWLRGRG